MEWADGVSALKDALRLEAFVTKKIRDVIAVCESPKDATNFNDYHVSVCLLFLWCMLTIFHYSIAAG